MIGAALTMVAGRAHSAEYEGIAMAPKKTGKPKKAKAPAGKAPKPTEYTWPSHLVDPESITEEQLNREGPWIFLGRDEVTHSDGTKDSRDRLFANDVLVDDLHRLSRDVLDRARRSGSPWLISTAHVLSALALALDEGEPSADEVTDRLAEMHKAAAKLLRTVGENNPWRFDLIPVFDAEGRPKLSRGKGPILAPAFDAIFEVVAKIMRRMRADKSREIHPLDAHVISTKMVLALPLPSIQEGSPPRCSTLPSSELTSRVKEQIDRELARALALDHRGKVAARTLQKASPLIYPDAQELTKALIKTELDLSGWSKKAQAARLKFLDRRDYNDKPRD